MSKTSKREKWWRQQPLIRQARTLVACVEPLLALFAELDDVFTEDEALSPEFRKISLGRCYEAWKRCRLALDPDFDFESHRRPRGVRRRGISI